MQDKWFHGSNISGQNKYIHESRENPRNKVKWWRGVCLCVHRLHGTTLGLDVLLHNSPCLRVLPNLLQKKKEPTVKIIHASLIVC